MSSEHPLEVLFFLFQVNKVDELLDCMSTLLVAADLHEVGCYPLKDLHSLIT